MLWIIATWLNPFLQKIKNYILFLGKQTSLKSTKHVSCFWSLFMSSDFNRPCQTMPTSHTNEISLNQIHLRCIFVLLGVKTEYISLDKIWTDTPVNKSIKHEMNSSPKKKKILSLFTHPYIIQTCMIFFSFVEYNISYNGSQLWTKLFGYQHSSKCLLFAP